MINRAITSATLMLLLAGCGGSGSDSQTPPASASITPLAADQMVFNSDRTGNFEIFVMKTDGSGVMQLTSNTAYDSWWARLSPNRKNILFYRTPKGVHDTDYSQTSLWSMNADGSDQTLLRAIGTDGWALQGHAEWSPDGSKLVMFGGTTANPQIHITKADGTQPQLVTDGTGYWLDPSWSPDGSRVTFCGCTTTACQFSFANLEIYTKASDGSGSLVRVTTDSLRDHDPYYSPDGSKIAWLTQTQSTPLPVWNIRIAAPNGSALNNVTNDSNINSKPDWSTDGAHIYFHRLVYGGTPAGWNIYRIQPNGAGLTLLSGQTGNNEFPDN